jgi:hypothetical protein
MWVAHIANTRATHIGAAEPYPWTVFARGGYHKEFNLSICSLVETIYYQHSRCSRYFVIDRAREGRRHAQCATFRLDW